MTDNTARKLPGRPFKPGEEWTGNDKGRPKGSRNKLGEAFIADVFAKWTEHGAGALDALIERDPGGFVRVVASLMPKEMIVKDELGDVSDEELAFFVHTLREMLREQTGDANPNLN